MIYLLTAIGLSPGGSSTVHIYTQTTHRTTQNKQYIEQHKNLYDILVNCNWVVTRWQHYSTHLHTNNTQKTQNKQYIEQHNNLYDILVKCNWVVTRWQQYSTHLHTNNTQKTQNKQYIEQHNNLYDILVNCNWVVTRWQVASFEVTWTSYLTRDEYTLAYIIN